MILIYITCRDKKEADKIGKQLLQKKLIACANIFPITSLYKWKGKITNDKETVLLLKTVEKNFEKIKKEVKSLHSYEMPCILKLNVKANSKYENWVKGELN